MNSLKTPLLSPTAHSQAHMETATPEKKAARKLCRFPQIVEPVIQIYSFTHVQYVCVCAYV